MEWCNLFLFNSFIEKLKEKFVIFNCNMVVRNVLRFLNYVEEKLNINRILFILGILDCFGYSFFGSDLNRMFFVLDIIEVKFSLFEFFFKFVY